MKRKLIIAIVLSLLSFKVSAESDHIHIEAPDLSSIISDEPIRKFESFLQRELECLALNVYFESKGEPYQGRLAVAQVVSNRIDSKHYPDTACEVVYQKYKKTCQFSWVCQDLQVVEFDAFQRAWQIAEEVLLMGKKSGIIGRNVYNFHATYVRPKWSFKMKPVAKIGRHIFYKKT